MAAALQIDGESLNCQQILPDSNSRPLVASYEEAPCSSSYVNKIIRVTTRQKQRIRVTNFANLRQLCDNCGVTIQTTPEIQANDAYCANPGQEGQGAESTSENPTGGCQCTCPCQQQCVYMKYAGPLITFPFSASPSGTNRAATFPGCGSAVPSESQLRDRGSAGSLISPSFSGNKIFGDDPANAGAGDPTSTGDAKSKPRSLTSEALDRMSNLPPSQVLLLALLMSPLLYFLFSGDRSTSSFYPQSLFNLNADKNDSMEDGVEKSIGISDPKTMRRRSSQDPDNEADVQVYDEESMSENNANTIVGPTGTRPVKDRVGDSGEYLDQTEDGKGAGDGASSGTDKNGISPVSDNMGPDNPAAAPSMLKNVGSWFGSETGEVAGRKSSGESSDGGYFGMTGDPSDGLPSGKCPTGRCGGKNRFY